MKRFFNILCKVLLVFIMIIGLALTVPKAFKIDTYKTSSYGSLAYVNKTNVNDIKVGDVVTFTQDKNIFTHRVVKINSNKKEFLTKDDKSELIDIKPVNFKEVIGKSIFTIPFLGYASSYIETVVGIISCGIISIALIVIIFFTRKKQ